MGRNPYFGRYGLARLGGAVLITVTTVLFYELRAHTQRSLKLRRPFHTLALCKYRETYRSLE